MGALLAKHEESNVVLFPDLGPPSNFIKAKWASVAMNSVAVIVLLFIGRMLYPRWREANIMKKRLILRDMLLQTFFMLCIQLWMLILLLIPTSWEACDFIARGGLLFFTAAMGFSTKILLKRAKTVEGYMPLWFGRLLRINFYSLWIIPPSGIICLFIFSGKQVFTIRQCSISYTPLVIAVFSYLYIAVSLNFAFLFVVPVILQANNIEARGDLSGTRAKLKHLARRNLLLSSLGNFTTLICSLCITSDWPGQSLENVNDQYLRLGFFFFGSIDQLVNTIVSLLLFKKLLTPSSDSKKVRVTERINSATLVKLQEMQAKASNASTLVIGGTAASSSNLH